jgi:hypothetical protein
MDGSTRVVSPTPRSPTTEYRTSSSPPCRDNKKNGNETDVDCGGGTCPRCANGKKCTGALDCFSGKCRGGVCVFAIPDLVFANSYNGSTAAIDSFFYWGSASGYSASRRTGLPTMGAAGVSILVK